MSGDKKPTEPIENSEKFKPQNVQEDGKAGPAVNATKPDASRGAEHHLQRKSMNRQ
jgi:hypothetical protein